MTYSSAKVVEDARNAAKEGLTRVSDSISTAVDHTRAGVEETAKVVGAQVAKAAAAGTELQERAVDSVDGLTEQLVKGVKAQPLTSLIIAGAIGLLIGKAWRSK